MKIKTAAALLDLNEVCQLIDKGGVKDPKLLDWPPEVLDYETGKTNEADFLGGVIQKGPQTIPR